QGQLLGRPSGPPVRLPGGRRPGGPPALPPVSHRGFRAVRPAKGYRRPDRRRRHHPDDHHDHRRLGAGKSWPVSLVPSPLALTILNVLLTAVAAISPRRPRNTRNRNHLLRRPLSMRALVRSVPLFVA